MRKIWIISACAVLWGCQGLTSASSGNQPSFATYSEDLSKSVPQYPDFQVTQEEQKPSPVGSSAQSVDGQLDEVQRKLVEKNKSEPYFSGYTVLVYSGVDRNQAFRTRDEIATAFPEVALDIQYQEPRYLVKVGRYTYKFEAQKNFSRIKPLFPSARIIQDRFQRKEYVAPQLIPNAQGQN